MAMRRNCGRKRDSSVPDSNGAQAHSCYAGRAEPPEKQWRLASALRIFVAHYRVRARRILNEGQVVDYKEVSNRGKTSAENLKVQR
jgi:hypothetical protein